MKETVKLKLSQGSLVEVECDGVWWNAKVVSLRGEVVRIHYVNGSTDFDFKFVVESC